MTVPGYQIQNILTLYCRKLENAWRGENNQNPSIPWKINIIAQSKKETVINKVTESIISKISRMGPRQYMKLHTREGHSFAAPLPRISPGNAHEFTFTVLEAGNVRSHKTITLGNNEQ